MDKKDVIKRLSSLHGVSGHEYLIAEDIKELFSGCCQNVTADPLGNVVGIQKSSTPNAPAVMLEAHMDEIGFMITDIDDNGFLYLTAIGGIDSRILPGKEIVIHGREDVVGVIGAKPPHVTSPEERDKAIPIKDLYVDTGYDAETVRAIICIGDTATFRDSFAVLGQDFISAKSQDDRTSIAVLYFVMDMLKDKKLPLDIYYCACVQEEVGRRGAATLANAVNPAFAVAVDVCHAKTPDAGDSVFDAGGGTVISRGPNIHPGLYDFAVKVLNKNEIKYSIDIDGGDTGTDAWAIQIAREGIPTLLFSIPLKYMHTMVETAHIDDVTATADAIASLITSIEDVEAITCMD